MTGTKYIEELIAALHRRMGVALFDLDELREGFSRLSKQPSICQKDIRRAASEAMKHLRQAHGLHAKLSQKQSQALAEPAGLANVLTRAIAEPYRPEFPRASEWRSEEMLVRGIFCSVSCVIRVLLPHVCVELTQIPGKEVKRIDLLSEMVSEAIDVSAQIAIWARAANVLSEYVHLERIYRVLESLPISKRDTFLTRLVIAIGAESKRPNGNRLEEIILRTRKSYIDRNEFN